MPTGILTAGVAERTSLANMDLYTMIRKLDRMRIEIGRCQSADMAAGLLPADLSRIKDYTSDVRGFIDYVKGKPIPDAPETHGNFRLPLPDDTAIESPEDKENDDVRQLLLLLIQLRMEIQNCQSARLAQGLIPFPDGQPGDYARFSDFLTRVDNYLAYIEGQEPSDRPESSPSSLPTSAGRLGT